MVRLYDHGISGRECLIEAASMWFYLDRNPRAVRTDLAFTYAIGTAVLSIIPHSKRNMGGYVRSVPPKGSDIRDAGQHIQKRLGLLLMNIQRHVYKKLKEKEVIQQEMLKEFD